MEHQTPDPQHGPSPSQGARVEDDFVRNLTPLKVSPRRLTASLPLAMVAILVVATVAFGATVVRPMVLGPMASATPVVVGDDGPDDTPTPAPTAAPTEAPTAAPTTAPIAAPTAEPTSTATSGTMTLTAKLSGRKVVLTWTAYDGADFANYKVVRSSDKEASWPLGTGDSLVAAISDQSTLTYTDSPPAGKTWSYEVFAVKSTADGYVVLDSTNLVTISVPAAPKPTPKPTNPCSISLSAKVSNGHVNLKWTKYTCDLFEGYVVISSETNSKLTGVLQNDGDNDTYMVTNYEGTDPGALLSFTDKSVKSGHTYYFRVYAVNYSQACWGGILLAQTNIVKVTIPVPATPPPSQAPSEAPSPS